MKLRLGNLELLSAKQIDLPDSMREEAASYLENGSTITYVAVSNKAIGFNRLVGYAAAGCF